MKQENNFEVKNIDIEEMNEIVEINDDELKMVTGGIVTEIADPRSPNWCRLN